MGLNKNSLREGQTSGAFWDLLHAYDLKSEFRKWLAHMCGEVWMTGLQFSFWDTVNPHAWGSLETSIIVRGRLEG